MFMHLHNLKPVFDANTDGSGGGTDKGNDPAKNGNGDEKTLTQAQFDSALKERLGRAEESGAKKTLEALGVKDLDEAKSKLTKASELEAAQLSDLEKANQKASDALALVERTKTEAKELAARAQTKLMKSAVLTEAGKQNFDETELESVWLALTSDKTIAELIKAKDDGESFEGVDKAVKKIAESHPRWLKVATEHKGTPRSRGGNGKDTTPQYKANRY